MRRRRLLKFCSPPRSEPSHHRRPGDVLYCSLFFLGAVDVAPKAAGDGGVVGDAEVGDGREADFVDEDPGEVVWSEVDGAKGVGEVLVVAILDLGAPVGLPVLGLEDEAAPGFQFGVDPAEEEAQARVARLEVDPLGDAEGADHVEAVVLRLGVRPWPRVVVGLEPDPVGKRQPSPEDADAFFSGAGGAVSLCRWVDGRGRSL
mmetsp:Transcript_32742/g.104357  ORF Transcript_32742/g.104357 Transcript_32742/m.104357 type:complete len:203 (+) Transcript_32742:1359-1967(+)